MTQLAAKLGTLAMGYGRLQSITCIRDVSDH